MSEEPILSDELLAELGNDPNAVIVGKKRKQEVSEEEKKRKYIPEDELKKFKKLSKKEQKRFEQREKKKERASKQGEYMGIIKANEISDQQRDMLLSSRQLNHTATLREQLTMLIKKEKAGIKLSEEELDLLYPNRHQQDEDNDSSDDDTSPVNGNGNTAASKATVPETSANETKEGTSETLFSFSSLFSPQATKNQPSTNGHDSDSSVDEKKKDKRKKKKKVQLADETNQQTEKAGTESQTKPQSSNGEIISKVIETNDNTVSSSIPQPTAEKKPFSAAGLGKNLLAQFSKIKEQKASIETKSDEKDTKVSTIFSSEFDYNPDAPKSFTSSVPEVPESIKELMAQEEAKAASIAPKPVLRDIYFNDRRHIPVERPHQVAIDRMNLPVCQMEQEIVEAVNNHDVIILCGETGSGKSTQVPQFLYEAGYAQDEDHLIGIAQPRRVAVTSTAERVNFEMGCTLPEIARQKKLNKHKKNLRKRKEKEAKRKAARIADGTDTAEDGDDNDDVDNEEEEDEEKQLATHYPNGRKVGYQIRYDATTVGSDTRIKFMTDGILLREISQDLLLRKYSVIILDEAHERNVNTDILLGMISRAIPLRKEIAAKEYKKWQRLTEENRANFAVPLAPLKLIIMSATLRVDDFRQERLFHPLPPIIKVEARQYPVTNHFAKRTETRDYLQEAFKKTCQIHERLPPGGVLMFLTGKREILFMCKRLQRALAPKKSAKHRSSQHHSNAKSDKEEEEATPFEAMLADLQPTSAKVNKKTEALNENNEDMKVGFDGDEIDEIEAGSELGEDDYDAMNWNDKKNQDDDDSDNPNDDDSVISDIDDEDYVPPVNNNNTKPKKGSNTGKGDDEDDDTEEDGDKEAARLRREMLANILGTNKKAETDVPVHESDNENDDTDKKESPTDENNEQDVNFDPDSSSRLPSSDDMPKLKPWILPLYAMMPAHLQKKVFAPVPAGYRLIVIATNVAETSITIPGIRYVVDCGRGKEKVLASGSVTGQEESSSSHVYEAGITRYEVKWISKASSDQRAGRAGRTGPGHCYRLYSSNFYHEHMQAFMPPEINVTPLEDIVLHMLSLGISEIESFPFPSNPPRAAVHAAVTLLRNLGAIQRDTVATRAKEREARLWTLLNQTKADLKKDEPKMSLGQLSPLGKMLRWFPIHPRFAKMLVVATQTTVNRLKSDDEDKDETGDEEEEEEKKDHWRLLSHVLTMVATLTERSVFVFDDMDDKDNDDTEDDDSDNDSDSDNNSDNDDDTGRKRKKQPSASTRHTAKKAKTTRHTKQSKLLQGRKLFYHTSGDVMARVRATGAYLYTLYTTLARHRQARHAAKEDAQRARDERQRQLEQEAGTSPLLSQEETSSPKSETVPPPAEGSPHETATATYQKWEYDLANQDPAVVSLCQTFHLHLGTLQRIVDLRNQLQHILESVFPRFLPPTGVATIHTTTRKEAVVTFPVLLEPPTNAEEIALRQILVAGYCDQIAKRSPFATIRAFLERQQQLQTSTTLPSSSDKPVNYLSRRRKFTAYLSGHPSLQTTGPVYLHPTSNMYAHDITQASETLPEYICYTHLMKNQRGDTLYLTNVTVIQPQWLATLALDCPLLHIRHSDVLQQLDVATVSSSSSSSLGRKPNNQHPVDDYHHTVKDGVAPYYDCVAEQMMLYVKPRYGVHLWALPSVSLSMRYVLEHWTDATLTNDNNGGGVASSAGDTAAGRNSAMPVGYRSEDLEYRWFARCLLLGHVPLPVSIPQLQRVSLTDAQCLQQHAPHPKLLALLRRLIETRVANRQQLLQALRETPQFLAKEIETLLKKEHQRAFRVQWQRLATFLETAAASAGK